VIINSREIYDYFPRLSYREKLVEPFVVTGTVGLYDVWCTVKGGGTTGKQAVDT
jgi:small subunit ribosomal protein S9